jgi:hypothetical protein
VIGAALVDNPLIYGAYQVLRFVDQSRRCVHVEIVLGLLLCHPRAI